MAASGARAHELAGAPDEQSRGYPLVPQVASESLQRQAFENALASLGRQRARLCQLCSTEPRLGGAQTLDQPSHAVCAAAVVAPLIRHGDPFPAALPGLA